VTAENAVQLRSDLLTAYDQLTFFNGRMTSQTLSYSLVFGDAQFDISAWA